MMVRKLDPRIQYILEEINIASKDSDKGELYLEKLPFPTTSLHFSDFETEVLKWYNKYSYLLFKAVLPCPVSLFCRRIPLLPEECKIPGYSKTVQLSPSNRLFLYESIINFSNVHPDTFFPNQVNKKYTPKLNSMMRFEANWNSTMINQCPIPNVYDSYLDFYEAYIFWYQQTSKTCSSIPCSESFTNGYLEKVLYHRPHIFIQYEHEYENCECPKLSENGFEVIHNSLTRLRYEFDEYKKRPSIISEVICDCDFIKLPVGLHRSIVPSAIIQDFIENGVEIDTINNLFIVTNIRNMISSVMIKDLIYLDIAKGQSLYYFLSQVPSSNSNNFAISVYILVIKRLQDRDIGSFLMVFQSLDHFLLLCMIMSSFSTYYYPFLSSISKGTIGEIGLITDQIVSHTVHISLHSYFLRSILNHMKINYPNSNHQFIEDLVYGSRYQVSILLKEFFLHILNWMNNLTNATFYNSISIVLITIVEIDLPEGKMLLEKLHPSLFFYLNHISKQSYSVFRSLYKHILLSSYSSHFLYIDFIAFCNQIAIESFDSFSSEFLFFLRQIFFEIIGDNFVEFDFIETLITYLIQFKESYHHSFVVYSICCFLTNTIKKLKNTTKIMPTIRISLSVLTAAISSPNAHQILFQSFSVLASLIQCKGFLENNTLWYFSILKGIKCGTDEHVELCWDVLNSIFLNNSNIIHIIYQSQTMKEAFLDALASSKGINELMIIRLISLMCEKFVDIDTPNKTKGTNPGFIFLIGGIQVDLLELSQMIKELGFYPDDRLRYILGFLRPEDKWKFRVIVSKFVKIIGERLSCKQLFYSKKK